MRSQWSWKNSQRHRSRAARLFPLRSPRLSCRKEVQYGHAVRTLRSARLRRWQCGRGDTPAHAHCDRLPTGSACLRGLGNGAWPFPRLHVAGDSFAACRGPAGPAPSRSRRSWAWRCTGGNPRRRNSRDDPEGAGDDAGRPDRDDHRGKSWFPGCRQGSTTEQVLRSAHYPFLAVPANPA